MLRGHLAAVFITGGTDFFSESPSLGRFDPHSEFWDHSSLLLWRYPMPRKDTPRLSIPDPNYFIFELDQQWEVLAYVKEVFELDQQWSLGLIINFEALSDTLPLNDTVDTFPLFVAMNAIEDVLPLVDAVTLQRIIDMSTPEDVLPLVDSVSMVLTIIFEHIEDRLPLSEEIEMPDGTGRDGWVLNADSGATGRYAWAQGFNSFVEHDGKFYAASDDGIYELTGATDAGTAIDALAVLGQTDFDVPGEKRARAVYVNARTDGGLIVRVVLDNNETFTYEVERSAIVEMQSRRAVLGRGLRGVNWQLAVGNTEGSDMEVDRVTIIPTEFSRRRG